MALRRQGRPDSIGTAPTKIESSPLNRRAFFMNFTVYILYSDSCGKFYSGQTQDLGNRIREHYSGKLSRLKFVKLSGLCMLFKYRLVNKL
jgi:hypothetical protein